MTGGPAQERAKSPDGHAQPPGDYASWDAYMHAVETETVVWRDREAARGLKAMQLAPSLQVYEALLAGQQVPRDALDPVWAKRYGLL